MFIVDLNYKKALSEVDNYLVQHREFLEDGYQKNYFIASGPKNPRVGGIIISQLTDRKQLENILKQDPFNIYDIADYTIIEFEPVKYHMNFSAFVNK